MPPIHKLHVYESLLQINTTFYPVFPQGVSTFDLQGTWVGVFFFQIPYSVVLREPDDWDAGVTDDSPDRPLAGLLLEVVDVAVLRFSLQTNVRTRKVNIFPHGVQSLISGTISSSKQCRHPHFDRHVQGSENDHRMDNSTAMFASEMCAISAEK